MLIRNLPGQGSALRIHKAAPVNLTVLKLLLSDMASFGGCSS